MTERLGQGSKIPRTKLSQDGGKFEMQRKQCLLSIHADRSRGPHPWFGVVQEEIRPADLIQLSGAEPGVKCGRIDN